jgi:hypothetical protein
MRPRRRRSATSPATHRPITPRLEPLEERLLLSAESDAFLGRVYQSVFGRPLDDTGRAAWGALLDQGVSRQAVVLDILASTECHTRIVEGSYRALLDRAADPQGLDAFVTALDHGARPEQIQAAILGSPEYAQHRGALTDAAFVQALYADVLGRAPDAQGDAAFTTALGQGLPRADVAAAVLTSPEAEGGVVAADYHKFLNRQAEFAGLSAWVGLLQQGAPPDWVAAGILTSPEYGLLGGSGGSGGSGSGGSSPATVPGGGHGTMSSGSSLCKAIQCPPPNYVYADQCGCAGQNLTRTAAGAQSPGLKAGQLFAGSGGGGSGGSGGSGAPVRYADGAVNLATCDLSSGGFGMGWGLTRSWTNAFMTSGFNGNGVVVAELPYLTQPSAGQVAPVLNAMDTPYYTSTGSGGNYNQYLHIVVNTLKYNSTPDVYVLTDTLGDQLTFYSFSSSLPANQQGRFKSFADPYGNLTQVTSLTTDGKPAEVQRSVTVGGVTTTVPLSEIAVTLAA